MKISRKSFLGFALGAGLAATWYKISGHDSIWSDNRINGQSFGARILAVGGQGHLFDKDKKGSVVSEVDLKSGWVRQKWIPLLSPHAPSYLPNNDILALSAHSFETLILDSELNVKESLKTPKGFFFGGHSLILEDYGWLAIAIKKSVSDSLERPGYIAFYDLKNYKFIKAIPAYSTFVHDMERIASDEIAISQYGTLFFDFQSTDRPYIDKNNVSFLMEPKQPTISYLNLKNLEYTQHRIIEQSHGLNHIALGHDKNLYSVSVQAVKKDESGLKYINDRYHDSEIVKATAGDHTLKDTYIVLPSPIQSIPYSINENVSEFLEKPSLQLRSQDLTSNISKDYVISTYPNSSSIGILTNGHKMTTYKTNNWGLESPRAVVNFGQSEFFALADQNKSMAIINSKDMSLATSIDISCYRVIHMAYRSV